MEFFVLLRKHLAMCGIKISQQSSKNRLFNVKNLLCSVLNSLNVVLVLVTLNGASNSFDDSTNMIFQSFGTGTCAACYLIIVWKSSKLFDFINSLADMVECSEYWNFIFSPKTMNFDYDWIIANCMYFCVHRTTMLRFTSTLHGNQSKIGKMDSDSGLCSFESNTNIKYMACFNYQLHQILHYRFGKFSFWIARPNVV